MVLRLFACWECRFEKFITLKLFPVLVSDIREFLLKASETCRVVKKSVCQYRLLKLTFLSLFHLPYTQTYVSKRATTTYVYKNFQSKLNKALLIITKITGVLVSP